MTKSQTMQRLLAHGPLSARDAIEITRWNRGTCRNVLYALAKDGTVRRTNVDGRSVYGIATAQHTTPEA